MSNHDMTGKTVMVTGATAGIGRVTALEIARRGATVVAVGRSEARSRETVEMIRRESGNPDVHFLLADLSSIAETTALANQFTTRFDRLHVLINNVGAIFLSRGETVDGIENTFALNHLVGYFLLTNLLLDTIKASAPARIVNVSSAAHSMATMDYDDLQNRNRYRGMTAYSRSKLANILFTYELARRLEGTGITVNALHPGMVASNFGVTNNNASALFRLGRKFFNLFSISEAKGAETSVYLATSPAVEGVTGEYFDKCRPKRSSDASYDRLGQERLWLASERILSGHGLASRAFAAAGEPSTRKPALATG